MHLADPQLLLEQWAAQPIGDVRLSHSVQQRLAERQAQELAAEHQHWFDATWDDMQRVAASAAQMHLKLPQMDERKRARERVAEYLMRVVTPAMWRRSHYELADRLLDSRHSYRRGVTPEGKVVLRWDRKAGLPLLCPDDAREEAMRLSRRVTPPLLSLLENGCTAHYGVLTIPNAAAGELRKVQGVLWKRFNSLMRACKRKDPAFPILGAVAVMESPLGWRRDWHPHLNVILICNGYLDYGKFRERWHWNVELRKLEGKRSAIERAFRELIKYACRTVPEKSEEGAAQLRVDRNGFTIPSPPPLIEWTPREFLEWWESHRRSRRSRTYGALYGLPKPPPLDYSRVRWVAVGTDEGGRWQERSRLLDSLLEFIPGDKSTATAPVDYLDRYKRAWQHLLGPPGGVERAQEALRVIDEHYGPVSLALE